MRTKGEKGENEKGRQREGGQKGKREDEKETEVKAARNQMMTDVSSPGAASSHQAAAPTSGGVPGVTTTGKRTLGVTWNDDEALIKRKRL